MATNRLQQGDVVSIYAHGSTVRWRYGDQEPRDIDLIVCHNSNLDDEQMKAHVGPAVRKHLGNKGLPMDLPVDIMMHFWNGVREPQFTIPVPSPMRNWDESEIWETVAGPKPRVNLEAKSLISSYIRGYSHDPVALSDYLQNDIAGVVNMSGGDQDAWRYALGSCGIEGLRNAIKKCRCWNVVRNIPSARALEWICAGGAEAFYDKHCSLLVRPSTINSFKFASFGII